jgi:hypothetical protein
MIVTKRAFEQLEQRVQEKSGAGERTSAKERIDASAK